MNIPTNNSLLLALSILFSIALCSACSTEPDDGDPPIDNTEGPFLNIRFQFDGEQERLDNFGNPSTLPNGHAAQDPVFHKISAHHIELLPNALTLPGYGSVLHTGIETTQAGSAAIDFDQALLVGEDELFVQIPLANISAGDYPYIRVSLSYQEYDIAMRALGFDLTGRVASFLGFNTYISDFNVGNSEAIVVNDDRAQGYWAGFVDYGIGTETLVGQAPEGATTVVNPLFATSPIPAGSCLVTGTFGSPLSIPANASDDIDLVLSLSTNDSFEWVDGNGNGLYDPLEGELPVDMGIRGMVPLVQ